MGHKFALMGMCTDFMKCQTAANSTKTNFLKILLFVKSYISYMHESELQQYMQLAIGQHMSICQWCKDVDGSMVAIPILFQIVQHITRMMWGKRP